MLGVASIDHILTMSLGWSCGTIAAELCWAAIAPRGHDSRALSDSKRVIGLVVIHGGVLALLAPRFFFALDPQPWEDALFAYLAGPVWVVFARIGSAENNAKLARLGFAIRRIVGTVNGALILVSVGLFATYVRWIGFLAAVAALGAVGLYALAERGMRETETTESRSGNAR